MRQLLRWAWWALAGSFLVVAFYQYPVVLLAVLGALFISVVAAGPGR